MAARRDENEQTEERRFSHAGRFCSVGANRVAPAAASSSGLLVRPRRVESPTARQSHIHGT